MSCSFPKIVIVIAIIFNNFINLIKVQHFFNTLYDKLNSQEKKEEKNTYQLVKLI